MKRRLSAAIVTTLVSVAGHAGEPSLIAAPSQPEEPLGRSNSGRNLVADAPGSCGTVRLGETTVATLRNAPIVTSFANGMAVTLLLDTGAQTTILTPPVAQRIGAQRPSVEFQRQMHGIAGSLQTSEVALGDHLFFPVHLEGRKLAAFIDTGAQFTVLSTKAASVLGVTEAALAHDRVIIVHGAAAEQLSAHVHRFSQLAVGTEIIRNLEIVVTDVRLNDADLVLGIDFLRSRRMWMSYGSQQIFLLRRT